MKTYYLVLKAVRESTVTTIRLYEYRVGSAAGTVLNKALYELQQTMGLGWHVSGEVVPRQYFDARVAVEMRNEQILLRGEGDV